MSGTHVFYNGVEMRDCETKEFSQKAKFDESKNLLNSVFRIKVESTVFGFFSGGSSTPYDYDDLKEHASTTITPITAEVERGTTATDRMHEIQKRLSQPRKDFWYATHGGRREDVDENIYQILIAASGEDVGDAEDEKFFKDVLGRDITIRMQDGYHIGGTDSGKIPRHNVVDTNNGPIPGDVSIIQLFGGRAFRVSFEIEIHRSLCLELEDIETLPEGLLEEDGAKPSEFVLSNTWSMEETCDEAFRRKRIVTGTLTVRDRRYWSHAFRSLCIPSLMPGYRRMSMRFASDPTNLTLKYSMEDKQAEAAPPWPIIDWSMIHVDGAKNEYGTIERQVSITLVGMPKANKRFLLGAALKVLDSRFPGASAMPDKENFLKLRPTPFTREALVITQPHDASKIELVCSVRGHVYGIGGFENATTDSANPLGFAGYDPDIWPEPRPYDADSPAGIFACYLQSPCSQWHGMPEMQRFPELSEDANSRRPAPDDSPKYWEEVDYQEYQSPLPLSQTADINRTDHIAYPYTHVEMDSRYVNNHGRMVLPYSSPRDVGTESKPEFNSLAVIPIHAGVQERIISINATRHGRPPELPEPVETLIDPNGIKQHLVGKSEIVIDAPYSSMDQSHRMFAVQARFTYVLSRPMANTETFMSGNNPVLATSPLDNALSGLALFSKGRIEFDRDAYGAPANQAPTRPPGINPAEGRPWLPGDPLA